MLSSATGHPLVPAHLTTTLDVIELLLTDHSAADMAQLLSTIPSTQLMKTDDETFLLFARSTCPFSNFYSSQFCEDGKWFNCVEQYFQYMKAVKFQDYEAAAQIMEHKTPKVQRKVGRMVRKFNDKEWNEVCANIMRKGNKAKFTYNPQLMKLLLITVGTTLMEVSQNDPRWSVGLSINDPLVTSRPHWVGRNLLGKILMEIRDDTCN